MTCRACGLEHEPWVRCEVAKRREGGLQPAEIAYVQESINALKDKRNHTVTTVTTICNQCVTKDGEIQRLRNQIEEMTPKPPKRDRAGYMRDYRKKANQGDEDGTTMD